MTWTTPILVEICVGLEINGYLPAEFWSGPSASILYGQLPWVRRRGVLSQSDMRLAWAGCARSATAEAGKPCHHRRRQKLSNASSVFPNGCGTWPDQPRWNAALGPWRRKVPEAFANLADFLICRTTRFSGLISRVTRLAASSGNL